MSQVLKAEKIWAKDPKDSFLVLHRPTGMYYVRAKRAGKRPLFKKTGFDVKARAKTKAMLMLAEWMGTRRKTDNDHILFCDFAPDFLEYLLKTQLRPRTKEQATIYITLLIKEIGHKSLRDLNEGFVDEWLAEFRLRSERTTFGDYIKYLSKALRHAHRKGFIERMPEFTNPDPPKKAGRVYSREEVAALMEHADPRLELQLRLCLQSFMRLREMLFLTWERIDLDKGLIRLGADDVKTGSKTGEGREFYVNAEIVALLRRRKKLLSPYVFPSPKDRQRPTWSNKTAWIKAKRLAGITGRARWHDLRHTALSWALTESKQNPLMVSHYAGVSLRTIQRVYLKVTPKHTQEVAQCIHL